MFLFFAVLLGLFAFPSQAVTVSAKHAVLIDADTGEILYEKAAQSQALIASTTKIMTAIVALETIGENKKIKISQRHATEGSSMYLKKGEIVSVNSLLYGLMLMSGNDAALALADATAGSVDKFVKLMNDKAARLSMNNTSFENPNGLDGAAHYSSAADMAKLTAYAMKNAVFSKIVSLKSVSVAGRLMNNHNRLLWECEGVDGLKTGYTKKAGRCLVTSAVRNGKRLICVTLNAGDDWNDHKRLYNYGYSLYRSTQLADADGLCYLLPVVSAVQNTVTLVNSTAVTANLSEKQKDLVRVQYELPRFVYAPVKAGIAAGYAVFTLEGTEIARTRLLYKESIDEAPPKMTLRRRLLEFLNMW